MRYAHGFTLLELLLALAIFALVSAMAYGGLNAVLRGKADTDRAALRLGEVQKALSILEREVAQAAPRGVRDPLGDALPALEGDEDTLEFTHAGWNNPAGQVRSTLRRVAYAVSDGALVRASWGVLDRAQDAEPYRAELLHEVEELTLRYLDHGREWQSAWPPLDPAAAALPLALEVTLDLKDWGTITRTLLLPGT